MARITIEVVPSMDIREGEKIHVVTEGCEELPDQNVMALYMSGAHVLLGILGRRQRDRAALEEARRAMRSDGGMTLQ